MVAYDYTTQRWIDGPQARDLLIEQTRETLDLLTGPEGAKYAQFIGADRQRVITECRGTLAMLAAKVSP